ncbi:unnamed protein product [Diabrotica balteata]|uniref:Uncharacterized protein n=1 Tax=Diabrotica balteata TaxID=107213 RepID=A0A9N9X6M4_DIABA|nr:unnamed protein product [Diabrotica balteata]
MHKLFFQKYEPDVYVAIQNDPQVTPEVPYDYFYRHFVTNYKYSFAKPQSHTCQKCDRLDNLLSGKRDEQKV